MATRKKTGTAVAKWDDELAKYAQEASAQEANTGGGSFFSTRGGQLSWQDSPLPNNEMAVIIIDHIFETVYYEGRYDPDTPQSPVAFAFGREESELRWHENSDPEFAGELCSESEVCEWGSAETGKGKAARETRRLAMIPAGQFNRDGSFELFDDPNHYEKAEIGFMKLPVTSVKGFGAFVKQVAGALKRPPFGVVARVAVVPDAKTQFKVTFEALEKVPDDLIGVIMERREEAMAVIDFPYSREEIEETPPPRSRAAKKPATRKAPAKKKPATKRGRKY